MSRIDPETLAGAVVITGSRELFAALGRLATSVRTPASRCRAYVRALLPFHDGKGVLGKWIGDRYAVLSESHDFPLYVHWRGVWFSVVGEVFPSAAVHRRQTHPGVDTIPLYRKEISLLLSRGTLTEDRVAQLATMKPMPVALIPILAAARIGALP